MVKMTCTACTDFMIQQSALAESDFDKCFAGGNCPWYEKPVANEDIYDYLENCKTEFGDESNEAHIGESSIHLQRNTAAGLAAMAILADTPSEARFVVGEINSRTTRSGDLALKELWTTFIRRAGMCRSTGTWAIWMGCEHSIRASLKEISMDMHASPDWPSWR